MEDGGTVRSADRRRARNGRTTPPCFLLTMALGTGAIVIGVVALLAARVPETRDIND